ncbi:MFS transporter [Streptomyces sp. NPDC046939]|uniref:MFS transporter n=1 Tax=Streptomyces sp. NPDC046939 TaxID=3155376 RepID=UPI0033D4DB3E
MNATVEESAPPAAAPARRWLSLAVLCLALLIVTLDNTVLNVVLPTLVRDLHVSSSGLQWIVDAYVLVFAGLLLVSGSLADRVGRKKTLLCGQAVFIAGSTWAAFSGSSAGLIAARAAMGVGAALIMPSTLSVVTSLFPDHRERQRAFGIWAATSGVGIALGPIVGGLLLSRFWWGSVFLINVPIVAVSLVAGAALLPDTRNPRAHRPDVVGSVLSIASLTLLVWAVIEAPEYGWTSAKVLGVGAGGLVALGAFVAWEARHPAPMLRLSFFRSRSFSTGIGTLAVVMFAGSGGLFVLTQYLQFDLGYSALASGVRLLPAAGLIVLTAPFAPAVIRVFGARPPTVAGLLVLAGGLWQFGATSVSDGYPRMLPFMILMGIGTGLVLPAATSAVMDSLPREHAGVGSATNSTFLQIGTVLGVAVVGSLLSTRYRHHMAGAPVTGLLPHGVEDAVLGSVGDALAVAAATGGAAGAALARVAREAFVDGMDLGLTVAAVVTAVAAVLAAFLLPAGRRRARQEPRWEMSDQNIP